MKSTDAQISSNRIWNRPIGSWSMRSATSIKPDVGAFTASLRGSAMLRTPVFALPRVGRKALALDRHSRYRIPFDLAIRLLTLRVDDGAIDMRTHGDAPRAWRETRARGVRPGGGRA